MSDGPHPASFRDPGGFLFRHQEKLYRQVNHACLTDNELLPFISYPYEWCFEQLKDAALATLRIQRLAISNNVPLGRLAEFFARAGRHLIIEFVAKTDSQVQRLLATREDIFSEYHQEGFESAFAEYFTIAERRDIPDTQRTLYLMRRK